LNADARPPTAIAEHLAAWLVQLDEHALPEKFMDNTQYGGWTRAQAERLRQVLSGLFAQPGLHALTEFRA